MRLVSNKTVSYTDFFTSQFTECSTQKKLDAVRENCDQLECFGLLIRLEEVNIAYWQYAELQQTA
jgi:hypothetical protein